MYCSCIIFFCKQKTAYEMRISGLSSDVCSSDLLDVAGLAVGLHVGVPSADQGGAQVGGLVLTLADVDRAQEAEVRGPGVRSEERRVGKECVSTCRSRASRYHNKKHNDAETHETCTLHLTHNNQS